MDFWWSIPQKRTNIEIRQSIIYYAWLLGRWDKWIVDQVSDVPSIIVFSWFQLFWWIFMVNFWGELFWWTPWVNFFGKLFRWTFGWPFWVIFRWTFLMKFLVYFFSELCRWTCLKWTFWVNSLGEPLGWTFWVNFFAEPYWWTFLVIFFWSTFLVNFLGEFLEWTFSVNFFREISWGIFWPIYLLTIASFRIGVPSILFFYRITKTKIKSFECLKSIKKY